MIKQFTKFAISLGIGLAIVPRAGLSQTIPALISLSPAEASAHPELATRRAILEGDRSRLRANAAAQKAKCSSVDADSAAAAACTASRGELSSQIRQHIADSLAFNEAAQRDSQKPAPTMAATPPTVMRAKTRGECVRSAGEDLRDGLNRCDGPVLACLKTEDVPDQAIDCVGETLGSGVAAVMAAAPGVGVGAATLAALGVTRAMHTCHLVSGKIAKACAPNAGVCQEEQLRLHKSAVAACPPK